MFKTGYCLFSCNVVLTNILQKWHPAEWQARALTHEASELLSKGRYEKAIDKLTEALRLGKYKLELEWYDFLDIILYLLRLLFLSSEKYACVSWVVLIFLISEKIATTQSDILCVTATGWWGLNDLLDS